MKYISLPAAPVTGIHTKFLAMWSFSFQLVSGLIPCDLIDGTLKCRLNLDNAEE